MGQPNFIAKAFVFYPCSFCFLQLLGMLIVTYIVYANEVYSVPVNNGRDFFEWSHITTKNFDIYEVARTEILKEGGVAQVPPRLQENSDNTLQLIFSCKDCDNVLTVENLRIIEEVE